MITLLKNGSMLELKSSIIATGIITAQVVTVDHSKDGSALFDVAAPGDMKMIAFARVRNERYSYLFIGAK